MSPVIVWSPERRAAIAVVSISLFVLLLPLMGLRTELARDTPLYHFFHGFDVPMIVGTAAALSLARAGRLRLEAVLGLTLLALVVVALLVHPSLRGLHFFARLAAAGALAWAVALIGTVPERRVVLLALGAAAATQSAIAVLQHQNGAPLGLWMLGEFADPLIYWGTSAAPRGTLSDGFVLAGLALVASAALVRQGLTASRMLPWLALAAITVVPLGLSHSRTAVLGLALVCACLLPGAVRSVSYRWAIAALLLGAALPGLLAWDGWTASAGRGVASDRGALLAQAAALTATSPLVGVGPARYDDELAALPDLHTTARLEPVHSVPMLFAAESGIPASLVMVVLLGALIASALRRGATTLMVSLTLVPWILLDQWPYTNTVGIALVGLWIGLTRWRPALAESDHAIRG
ncbi:MAG: O-antigen ligase family protein [Candidatus Limnocylindria bacterium]